MTSDELQRDGEKQQELLLTCGMIREMFRDHFPGVNPMKHGGLIFDDELDSWGAEYSRGYVLTVSQDLNQGDAIQAQALAEGKPPLSYLNEQTVLVAVVGVCEMGCLCVDRVYISPDLVGSVRLGHVHALRAGWEALLLKENASPRAELFPKRLRGWVFELPFLGRPVAGRAAAA
jgi:hypothetical protein